MWPFAMTTRIRVLVTITMIMEKVLALKKPHLLILLKIRFIFRFPYGFTGFSYLVDILLFNTSSVIFSNPLFVCETPYLCVFLRLWKLGLWMWSQFIVSNEDVLVSIIKKDLVNNGNNL